MLEHICLQFWNGQLKLFWIHFTLELDTFWKFCQMKLFNKISIILRV